MRKIKHILLIIMVFPGMCHGIYAQQKKPPKINDIFFEYVVQTLELKPQEAEQMRPLVKEYLYKRKKIGSAYGDPLECEKKVLDLKISFRQQISGIIGMQRANSFFTSEQNFRRKVREEIRQRSREKKF